MLGAKVNYVFPCVDAFKINRSNLYLLLAGIAQHAFQRIPLLATLAGGPIHILSSISVHVKAKVEIIRMRCNLDAFTRNSGIRFL